MQHSGTRMRNYQYFFLLVSTTSSLSDVFCLLDRTSSLIFFALLSFDREQQTVAFEVLIGTLMLVPNQDF